MVLRSQSGAYRHVEHVSGTVGCLQRLNKRNREDLHDSSHFLNESIVQTQLQVWPTAHNCWWPDRY